ncbi:MAG: N-acetylmuramoyl-L-alanine amidase, partial [Myxococcota bacterium]
LERLDAAGQAEGTDFDACEKRLRQVLSVVAPFRPTGEAWSSLQRAAAAIRSPPKNGPGPVPSASVSAAPPPEVMGLQKDVVVVPKAKATKRVRLLDVQTYGFEQAARVVLKLDGPTTYTVGALKPSGDRGHRVFLDLAQTRFGKVETKPEGLVEAVRLGKRKDRGSRVVLDLKAEVRKRIYYLPDPFRVVIDLVSTAVEPPSSAEDGRVKRRRPPIRRVALDPGHGGWDGGAVGPTGLREKDVVLDIAHRAAPALATELGIDTLITRDTDAFIELDERTAKANAFRADLFVSIHCNATESGEARGFEVFILDPSRASAKRSLGAVARENRFAKGERQLSPAELDAQLSTVAKGLLSSSNTERSRHFADLLRRSTSASLSERFPDTTDHGLKTAGFFVLVGAHMPAVLYETSFVSNPEDEARLATADYRQKLADAIVNAVRAYNSTP